nr:MAG TPA: hypothetical protein [Bacteriophage sp.]
MVSSTNFIVLEFSKLFFTQFNIFLSTSIFSILLLISSIYLFISSIF